MVLEKKIYVIGGGASGFFYAINHKINFPTHQVVIIEKAKQPMQKIKVSGGGRCNITYAEFIPRELVKNYPRGYKELPSIFSQFQPSDVFEWFEKRDVSLYIQDDMRVFPTSDSSQTIIDCFLSEAQRLGISIQYDETVTALKPYDNKWKVISKKHTYTADKVIISTGGSKSFWQMLENIGVPIIQSVPSLFTFVCKDKSINDLMGLSMPECETQIIGFKNKTFGPVLLTHWGFSGPGILKLSAWLAPDLAELKYQFKLQINWVSEKQHIIEEELKNFKVSLNKNKISGTNPYEIPKRLWQVFLQKAQITLDKKWGDCSHKELVTLAQILTQSTFTIDGKSTFKDEFVSAGGVDLKAVDCKTMELKNFPGLHVLGEALNIDAITGGFNFQNAWSTAWVASKIG